MHYLLFMCEVTLELCLLRLLSPIGRIILGLDILARRLAVDGKVDLNVGKGAGIGILSIL